MSSVAGKTFKTFSALARGKRFRSSIRHTRFLNRRLTLHRNTRKTESLQEFTPRETGKNRKPAKRGRCAPLLQPNHMMRTICCKTTALRDHVRHSILQEPALSHTKTES